MSNDVIATRVLYLNNRRIMGFGKLERVWKETVMTN